MTNISTTDDSPPLDDDSMKFTYRLIRDRNGFLAECIEAEAAGEGKTAKDAVLSLRKSLEERMFRPDAVAPPSQRVGGTIVLVLADDATNGGDDRSDAVGPIGHHG